MFDEVRLRLYEKIVLSVREVMERKEERNLSGRVLDLPFIPVETSLGSRS